MQFRGHAHRSMDDKGRIMLPQDFRDAITAESPESLVVLTLFDKHVIGMTPEQWAKTEAEVKKVKSPSKAFQQFSRILFSGYEQVSLDKQGRLAIPTHLRRSGRLDRDNQVVVLGVDQRFEFWSANEHEDLLMQDYDVSEELAENGVALPF